MICSKKCTSQIFDKLAVGVLKYRKREKFKKIKNKTIIKIFLEFHFVLKKYLTKVKIWRSLPKPTPTPQFYSEMALVIGCRL